MCSGGPRGAAAGRGPRKSGSIPLSAKIGQLADLGPASLSPVDQAD